jgi:hypothetical protein
MTSKQLLPLTKKTAREQRAGSPVIEPDVAGRRVVRRYDGVPVPVYERMVQAVECAVQESSYSLQNNAPCVIPLVLDVHNVGVADRPVLPPARETRGSGIDALLQAEMAPDTYFLAYYPCDRATALRLLQSLYVLHGDEHSALVLALCHPDIVAREFPSRHELALVAKYSGGASQVGRFERTYDIDDLHGTFDRPLYVQQCHADLDTLYEDDIDVNQ